MQSYRDIAASLYPYGMICLGGFHPEPEDVFNRSIKTLVLIGPNPDTFWMRLQDSPEIDDPHPIDAYSRRVIGHLACALNSKAYFPFGNKPAPFVSWALRSGLTHQSPLPFLIHEDQGLMVSYRGALGLRLSIDLPKSQGHPCKCCKTKECLTACPVNALANGYDLELCGSELSRAGNTCMTQGCLARRSCPLSKARDDAQSQHHMAHLSFRRG